MEKPKTQTEARKQEFDKHARLAKDIANSALVDIDLCLNDYYQTFQEKVIAIIDDDPLADPIGYYEQPENIYK